jgi:hypothetical protein
MKIFSFLRFQATSVMKSSRGRHDIRRLDKAFDPTTWFKS